MILQPTLLELNKIEQDAIIELFDVDLTNIIGEKTLFRFHNGMNELRQVITWQDSIYQPYPIQAQGFEKNGQGTSNRPTLTVANISGLITGLSQDYEDLLGAVVTRRQLLAKFLDSANFKQSNPAAGAMGLANA